MALTAAQILRTGVDLLDEYGLADLSMRRLAAALDVQAGALYHHVPDKQTLLAGMADLILESVTEPLGPWRRAVTEWADSLRSVLLAHRDSAELVASSRAFRLLRTDSTHHPAILLSAAGGDVDAARSAAVTLLHFILGHVAEEQARLDWERYGRPRPDEMRLSDDVTFATGVGLILDGVSVRL